MTPKQISAAESLERAIKKCKEASLKGYVFEGNLCLCPENIEPQEEYKHGNFRGQSFSDTITFSGYWIKHYGMS